MDNETAMLLSSLGIDSLLEAYRRQRGPMRKPVGTEYSGSAMAPAATIGSPGSAYAAPPSLREEGARLYQQEKRKRARFGRTPTSGVTTPQDVFPPEMADAISRGLYRQQLQRDTARQIAPVAEIGDELRNRSNAEIASSLGYPSGSVPRPAPMPFDRMPLAGLTQDDIYGMVRANQMRKRSNADMQSARWRKYMKVANPGGDYEDNEVDIGRKRAMSQASRMTPAADIAASQAAMRERYRHGSQYQMYINEMRQNRQAAIDARRARAAAASMPSEQSVRTAFMRGALTPQAEAKFAQMGIIPDRAGIAHQRAVELANAVASGRLGAGFRSGGGDSTGILDSQTAAGISPRLLQKKLLGLPIAPEEFEAEQARWMREQQGGGRPSNLPAGPGSVRRWPEGPGMTIPGLPRVGPSITADPGFQGGGF